MNKIYYCDLCKQEIYNYKSDGRAMLPSSDIDLMDNNQVIARDDITIDICKRCCIILVNASEIGVVGEINL